MDNVFAPAHILLPGPAVDLEKWACVACDQFTSQPDYWRQADALVGGAPSTLRLILPEVYLGQDDTGRIAAIRQKMALYQQTVLTRSLDGYVYVERTTASGVRPGLVGAVDLEAYSYTPGAPCAVRPSEATVPARIPPRLAVRRGAPLESPHVLLLADDRENTLLGHFAAKKAELSPLYDTPLMLGGGRVAGWAVTDPADLAFVADTLAGLGGQAAFDARYPAAAGRPPFTLAVGDGNHSLATAKAAWEEVKAGLSAEDAARHPARWCLAEVESLICGAICIEGIHRLVKNVDFAHFFTDFSAFVAQKTAKNRVATATLSLRCTLVGPNGRQESLAWQGGPWPLAVGAAEAFLADWLPAHPEAEVDYIHGEGDLRALCEQGAVGVLLDAPARDALLTDVALGGVLPKKSFSMGHAEEKRYYLECRKITL